MPNGQALCRRQARSQRGPFSSPLWGCVSPRRDTLLRRREHRGGRRGRIFRRLSDVSANRGAPLPCQRGGHRRGARAPPQIAFKTAYQIGHRGCSTVTRLRVPSSATRPGGARGAKLIPWCSASRHSQGHPQGGSARSCRCRWRPRSGCGFGRAWLRDGRPAMQPWRVRAARLHAPRLQRFRHSFPFAALSADSVIRAAPRSGGGDLVIGILDR